MSLSKLDSAPTSGSSFQVAFDDQNPLSKKQHPLLLPTVLDTIFPYLTFAEVKSNRLVCKPWGEVGIPFIGRRNLEPVNFSDVSHEDFIALKQEFQEFEDQSKPHPKLKLFQGFRLNWEQVGTMVYCNFMPSFKPSQLYVSGNVINNPSASLRTLLQPIVATLRDLTLKIKWAIDYECPLNFDILRNLARLGMTLQRFHLQIFNEGKYVPRWGLKIPCGDGAKLRRYLSYLLANQAPYLDELSLKFECYVGRNDDVDFDNKIQLPIFPRLQSLALAIQFNIDYGRSLDFFQPFDFCTKFPNLLHLDILNLVLSEMAKGDTFNLTKGHPLKKLNIRRYSIALDSNLLMDLNKLGISFPLLEEFSVQDSINEVVIPWVDTMKNLEICGPSHEFNFLRLKKLEYLHYTIHRDDLNEDINVDGLINSLLDHYTQLPHLKKFHLSGLNICPVEFTQKIQGLPSEFRAIITLDKFC